MRGEVAHTELVGPASPPEKRDAIERLLQRKHFHEARQEAEGLVVDYPGDVEAQYLLAVSLRYCGAHERALGVCLDVLALRADYGRAYQERGHNFVQLKRFNDAADAFRQALALNPALLASWRGLALALRELGDLTGANAALEQFKQRGDQPAPLQSAASMLNEGKLYKAERLCRRYLLKHPHHPEAMRLLAKVGSELGVLDDADFLLESCVELYPDFNEARRDFVDVLQKRQKFEQALSQARLLRERLPDSRSAAVTYANALVSVGRYREALAIFDELIERFPSLQNLHMSRGHALKTRGESAEAVEAYQAAYRCKPDFGDAYWSLANLKTYRFSDREIKQMEAAEREPLTLYVDRYHLSFALGKAYEDRGLTDQSFYYYQRGNDLRRQRNRYSSDRNRRDTRSQVRHCTETLFQQRGDCGYDAPDPIFIVGLPRAGSTLLEQILASHSQVEGTLELPNILAIVHRLNGRLHVDDEPRYPGNLWDLTPEQLRELGEQYIRETRIHRSEGVPFFIDKMPNNFRHIGLIRLILPNAKIIDARRHPMACCFSGYKQLFAEGQEFTYGQREVGDYYRAYVELMEHWDRVLPGSVCRVHYEAVISDLESQVRRLLDYCGLRFEEACLNFHETRRSVRTASSEQVRQPLYQSGVDQWRAYSEYLGPLKEALGPLLDSYPYP